MKKPNSPGRITSSTTSAPSAGCRLRTRCPGMSITLATTAGNFGWQPNGSTQLRGTVHYGVAQHRRAERMGFLPRGGPGHSEGSGSLHQRVARQPDHGGLPQHGALRSRRANGSSSRSGRSSGSGTFDAYGDSLGNVVTITGANGYSASGQAVLDYAQTYPYQYSTRLQSRSAGVPGRLSFHAAPGGTYRISIMKTSAGSKMCRRSPRMMWQSAPTTTTWPRFTVTSSTRFFYTLGGSLEHYSLFGVETSPRAGRLVLCAAGRAAESSAARGSCSTMATRCASRR